MKTVLVCNFDGACEPRNPGGNMGIGAVVVVNGKEIFTYSHFVPAHRSNTNNVAEYMAFERLLDWLAEKAVELKNTRHTIEIKGDSMLVIAQLYQDSEGRTWKIKKGAYVEFANRCKGKLAALLNVGLHIYLSWVPRAMNERADELSKGELIKHNVQFKIQPQ